MRSSNYAVYNGIEYEFYETFDGDIKLISSNIKDMNNGFIELKQGKYVKLINLKEITSAYSVRTYGIYKGYKFAVRAEENDKYHLEGGYNHNIMVKLNFEMIEWGVYRKWVRKAELEKIWEEKTPLLGFNK